MKKEYKKYLMLVTIIALTILSVLYTTQQKSDPYEINIASLEPLAEIAETEQDQGLEDQIVEDQEPKKVPIYVCGAVKRPDVYYLDEWSIIKEAIHAAGGFTDQADREAWNLAMEIQKGEKIYVPKVGEQIDKTDNSYDNREGGVEPSHLASDLLNINKASYQELTSLSGIGPVIAQNIIEYREANGDFENLQDITKVSRIGQGTFDKIKDSICLQ